MSDSIPSALKHVDDAVAAALTIPGISTDTKSRPIRSVGVIGAGTMGGGIAMNFLNAGLPVTIVDITQAGLDHGIGNIRRNYEASAKKGRITQDDVEQRMRLLSGTLTYKNISDCDLIIEAVFEDLALKLEVCKQLGAIAKRAAIIATNTSTLDVNVLADATGRPCDVVGLHFFSPANVMRLLEVVRGRATADDVLTSVIEMADKIGKSPVVSGVCYGFIGNRMAEVYMREAEYLLLEGASPSQIDDAVQSLGMAMGPCRMLDMAGIDVGAKTVIEWKKSGDAPADPSYRVVVDELYRIGRHGQKSGKGYYRYEGRTPIPDPDVETIAIDLATRHGISRKASIGSDEIVKRLLYPLINEGCRILEEGISYRPGDIDAIWTLGYGFPKELGGPMYWAEAVGLQSIVATIREFAATRGNEHGYWTPARLLTAAADRGHSISDQMKIEGL